MAVIRQLNILGQERLDVPHLRSFESGVAADFDVLAGKMLAGDRPMVIRGFRLITSGISQASQLKLDVAGGLLIHPRAAESGSMLEVPEDRVDETLSSTNTRVTGAFAAGQTNYIGVDFARQADDSTKDLAMFLDSNTMLESAKTVPLARTLDYRIVISTLDFSATPGLAPIAKVTTDSSNNIVSTEDARDMFFRLGSGGGAPDALRIFEWPNGRLDSGWDGADKSLNSLKDWCDSVMTRLWELGGGERWFSPAADRNSKMVITGAPFSNGEYFEWDGTNLHWKGLSFVFDNSTATFNDLVDQTSDSAGLTDLADGECIYVDVDRTTNRTAGTALVAVKAPLATLGMPAVPGSRFVLAWRKGSDVFARDQQLPVGQVAISHATTTSNGLVRLSGTAGAPTTPYVATLNASYRAIAAGMTRAGSIGAMGNGTLNIGPDATADTNVVIGHTASVNHQIIGAGGNATNAVVDVQNHTDANVTSGTWVQRWQQNRGGSLVDLVRLVGNGTMQIKKKGGVSGTYLPMGADEVTLAIQDNGLASPNTRLQLVVVYPDGLVQVIGQGNPF